MDKLNTHHYDYKLKGRMQKKNSIGPEEKQKVLKILIDSLVDESARSYARTICADIGKSSNYDVTNDLIADDILYECALLADEKNDVMKVLEQQLSEMSSGACPQGRCVRLFQVLDAFVSDSK